MQQAENIWKKALEYLSGTINPTSYSRWIAVLKPVSADGGVFVLATDNDTVFKTVDMLYKTTIQSALKFVSDTEYALELHLGEIAPEDNARVAPMLNPRYTFDTFVVGESNQMAHAAALAITDFFPEPKYNPFFLYSSVGLGKTHLIHAIGNEIYKRHPDKKILYVSSETFANEVISAIRPSPNNENTLRSAALRKKYRDVDMLMIDDIQFIAGKQSTESEFFHTFNALFLENKQIIITSDKAPQSIPMIDDRMTTRFSSGIVVDMQSPDFETRAAILRNRAQNANVSVSNDMLDSIAEKVDSNIRELEGAFNTIVAHAQLTGCRISHTLIDRVLKDMVQTRDSHRVTNDMVINAVSDYYYISTDDIKGKKRDKYVALSRQIAMYLCRTIVEASYRDIGDAFGGKHYSTVIHAYESIAERLKSSPGSELQVAVDDISSRLKNL